MNSFVENIKTNLTLIRERLCTTNFKIEMNEIGKTSKTRVLLCYMKDRVNPDTLAEVKKRLKSVDIDTVLAAGDEPFFRKPYLTAPSFPV